MKHDEMYENTWGDNGNKWLPCLKNDVLSTVFSSVRNVTYMELITRVGMKNSLTILSWSNKNFNRLTDEIDETIYTYDHQYVR